MTAPNAKTADERIVKPIRSVHVVVFTCPHCGEDYEELKLCKECKSPMKVVQVVEKFGAEAEEYLNQLKRQGKWLDDHVTPVKDDDDDDDGAISDDLDLDIPINGLTNKSVAADEDTVMGLTDIFPADDDDDDDHDHPTAKKGDDDLMDALAKLDEEEEGPGVDETLPEL